MAAIILVLKSTYFWLALKWSGLDSDYKIIFGTWHVVLIATWLGLDQNYSLDWDSNTIDIWTWEKAPSLQHWCADNFFREMSSNTPAVNS